MLLAFIGRPSLGGSLGRSESSFAAADSEPKFRSTDLRIYRAKAAVSWSVDGGLDGAMSVIAGLPHNLRVCRLYRRALINIRASRPRPAFSCARSVKPHLFRRATMSRGRRGMPYLPYLTGWMACGRMPAVAPASHLPPLTTLRRVVRGLCGEPRPLHAAGSGHAGAAFSHTPPDLGPSAKRRPMALRLSSRPRFLCMQAQFRDNAAVVDERVKMVRAAHPISRCAFFVPRFALSFPSCLVLILDCCFGLGRRSCWRARLC